ncbi:MAG: ABC-type transporter, integral rane subunit [Gemmatimonadetes bacterium]|nr:ABC-type transporter, integral rane subunit [Gemmatimonadota bacterium]
MRAERSLLARLPRESRIALGVIAALALLALLGPLVVHWAPNEQLDIVHLASRPPSLAHPLGTDRFSRDLLSRVIHGARLSLSVALLSVLLSTTVGLLYGTVAGWNGGWVDAALMRLLDALLAIPRVLLLVAMLALFTPVPLGVLILLLGLTGWFGVSRLVRAEVMAARDREYVLAARGLGASASRLVFHHVWPNVLGPVIVSATLGVANVVVLEAGLAYLGVGAREPAASWGRIFRDGADSFAHAWWVAFFPGIAIVVTALAFNVLGDGLRDALDPRNLVRSPMGTGSRPGITPQPIVDG